MSTWDRFPLALTLWIWGGENRPAAFRLYANSDYVFFPPATPAAFFNLIRRIKSGQVQSRQLDWGCRAAKMSKLEILAFIDEVYADSPYKGELPAAADESWHVRFNELIAFVNGLPDQHFAVVAIET